MNIIYKHTYGNARPGCKVDEVEENKKSVVTFHHIYKGPLTKGYFFKFNAEELLELYAKIKAEKKYYTAQVIDYKYNKYTKSYDPLDLDHFEQEEHLNAVFYARSLCKIQCKLIAKQLKAQTAALK